MLPDRLNDPLPLGENFLIAEPENGPIEAFQFHLSEMVSQDDVIAVVNPAVDLEDEPEPVAGEVGEVSADGVLPPELMTVDPGTAKAFPQPALRQPGGLPLAARKSCAPSSHDTIMDCLSAGSKGVQLTPNAGRRPTPFRLADRFAPGGSSPLPAGEGNYTGGCGGAVMTSTLSFSR